ncbi:MAG: DUF4175 family protein [Flavobacteriaceae bacterium]|nr:DUF4175 family protein [Flavobacteriaceae bacterium]
MSKFKTIQDKLEQFIRKYYANELIKGAIFFFSIGLLYFLTTLLIEYFLWLDPAARTVLFWAFVLVELGLFIKFMAIPLAQLFKLKKGIDQGQASRIIGNHFPEVNDKLLNVLQLNQSTGQSELLIASIEQKSAELNPVPFKLAIDFKNNLKYLKYAALPLIIVFLVSFSGNFNWFSDGYERVVNYQTAYEPPAPFEFFIVNDELNAIEGSDFKLVVRTAGDIIPENAEIIYSKEVYFMQQSSPGEFQYVFSQLKESTDFRLEANGVSSRPYKLSTIETPSILGFEMALDYPSYTKKQDQVLKNTGNATIPQGTGITWRLKTKSTEQAHLFSKDTIEFDEVKNNSFEANKRVYGNLDYSISTSNTDLKDYENLAFSISVIPDEYPELNLEAERDSIDQQTLYFYGQVSDDYGLSKLQLVYYPIDDRENGLSETLPVSSSNFDEFVTSFPNELNVKDGVSYELYFEVFDNDAIHKFKSVKSEVFTFRKLTKDEQEQQQLQQQSETIQDLNKALDKFEEQEKNLEELSKTQKEKSELNFNDKKKFEQFLKRQKEQEELMQNFNKKFQENLEEFQKEEQDPFKEQLQERLEENQEQLEQDEKLLKELQKLAEKINKEEFSEKLDKLAKQNKNQKRSLEQMLELTKRYYVNKKLEKLKQKLDELAKIQEEVAKKTEEKSTKEEQSKLNEEFEDFQKEMSELEKENKKLNKPMPFPRDKPEEKKIDDTLKDAIEKLEQQEQTQDQQQKQQSKQSAQKSQQKAAQKMKKMSQKMGQSMQMSGGEQMMEDAEMLRQILDNLVLFSFDQEALMEQFKSIEVNHNQYAKHLRKQSTLREHFQHIDDSLFALSLRQPRISEKVNKEITEVFFNIDKALGQLAENRLYQGVATQQYAVTSANNLADMLSNSLDNMQMQMSGMGQGQGNPGDQLPDIIMSQEQLNEQMKQGMKEKGKEGKKGEEGEEGEKGEEKGRQQGNQEGEQQGEGEGVGEGNESVNGKLFEIYQQQQRLRMALEEQLKNMEGKYGAQGQAKKLIKDMEEVELDLINKGFTNQTLQKMMKLQHQLLKLENAALQQGQDTKRQSETNNKQFINNTKRTLPIAKKYFNTTEILNRQALPLRQEYKQKVQDYFRKKND